VHVGLEPVVVSQTVRRPYALQVVGRCLTWQAVWFRNEFGSHALCRIKQPASRREVGICSVCLQCSCVVVRCPCTVQAAASLCGLDSTTQIWVYTQAAPAHTSAVVYCGGCACHCLCELVRAYRLQGVRCMVCTGESRWHAEQSQSCSHSVGVQPAHQPPQRMLCVHRVCGVPAVPVRVCTCAVCNAHEQCVLCIAV
jgi:hypothetical protein